MASLTCGAGCGVSRKTPGATRAIVSSRTAPATARSTAESQAEVAPAALARLVSRAAGPDRVVDSRRVVAADRFIASRGIVAGAARACPRFSERPVTHGY